MLRVFSPTCYVANIAGILCFAESNAMSPCSPLAASTQLFPHGTLESQLDFGRDFDGKSAENRSKIGCGSDFRPRSASESIWGTFWARFSYLGGNSGRFCGPWLASWGPLGRPWESQGAALRRLGVPRGSLGSLWGPSWDPSGRPLGSRG